MTELNNTKIRAALIRAYAEHARDVFECSELFAETKERADERMRERTIGAREAIRDLADELGIYIDFQSITNEIAKDYPLI